MRYLIRIPLAGLCGLLCLLTGLAGDVSAHRLSTFAFVEGDAVRVESKFASGNACQDCAVTAVETASKKTLASGATDGKGVCSIVLAAKPNSDVTVTVSAGGGHQGEWTLAASEFAMVGAAPTAPAPAVAAAPAITAPERVQPAAQATAGTAGPGLDEATLRRVVAEEVDKRVAPLRAMLIDSKLSGPSATEIAGGIGYIFGLAGLFAMLKGRRK